MIRRPMSEAKTVEPGGPHTRVTPLEDRTCGECVACCITPRIETEEIRKEPGVKCQHGTSAGCAIYESRPPVCRTYLCGWRQAPDLADSWRPDRSGVILFAIPAPHGYASEIGLELAITEGENTIRRPYFAAFVAENVYARRAIFMTIDGTRALLNPYLEPLLPRGVEAIRQQLLRFHAGATTHRNSPKLPP